MANEVTHNYITGKTLYFCCFQQDGDVFLTGGASDEVWGTGGRTADDYDEAMSEEGGSGHYKGSIAGGVGAGVYQIAVYNQAGANPADADICIGQGEIYWDGSAEMNPSTLDGLIDTIDANVDEILVDTGTTLENHLTDIKGTGFVKDTDSLVDLAHTGADGDTLETLSDQLDTVEANTGKVVNVYPTGEAREITGGSNLGYVPDED